MTDEATCRHCGGRILWDGTRWQENYLSDPPWAAAVPAHDPMPAVLAHQRWAPLRRQTDRPRVMPWQEPEFRVWHPDTRESERCLSWLRLEFGARNG